MAKGWKQARIVLLGAVLVSFGQAASPQSTFGVVEGRVTCNDGNVPARAATVQLIPLARLLPDGSVGGGSAEDSLTTHTDFSGGYSLSTVAPGAYLVNATMAGYEDNLNLVRASLSRYTPDQQKSMLAAFPQLIVKAGASFHQDLLLRRAGAISGTVSVDAGGIVPQAMVKATLVVDAAGQAPAQSSAFSQSASTDDRGVFRIAGLIPGTYRVSVRVVEQFFGAIPGGPQLVTVVPQRTGLADLTVFVPEVLVPSDAKPIRIVGGDELTNVDIAIPTRLLRTLAGTVTRGGQIVANVNLSLEAGGKPVGVSSALSMPDGSFEFDLLPDGTYTLIASTYDSGRKTGSTRIPVLLQGSDIPNLVVDLPNTSRQ